MLADLKGLRSRVASFQRWGTANPFFCPKSGRIVASCSLRARPGPTGAPLRYAALHSAARAAKSLSRLRAKNGFWRSWVARFFSASVVLGSRPGSVGVAVAGCRGAAWVFSRRAPRAAWSLALAVPAGWAFVPRSALLGLPLVAPGVSVSVRSHRGRCFLRVRGPVSALRVAAAWWSASFFGAVPGAPPVAQGS